MLTTIDSRAGRIIEFRSNAKVERNPVTVFIKREPSLSAMLGGLRESMDSLTARLTREYGSEGEPTIRAEQIAHAMQRLARVLQQESDLPPAG